MNSVKFPSNHCSENNSSYSVHNKPLAIALLGYRSDPHVGGQGIYIKYLSKALHDLGHKVDVYSGPPYPELYPEITLHKVPSLDLYTHANHVAALRFKHLKSFTDIYEWWTMLTGGFGEPYTFGRRIVKALKGKQYDVIHDNQSLCYGLIKLQKKKQVVVSTIHHPIHRDRELALASAPNKLHRTLVRRWHSFLRMQEKVSGQLSYAVTVSEVSLKDIKRYFGRSDSNTRVIPNGIDTTIFRPLPQLEKTPYQLITTASADQPLKGLRFLLAAIALLKEEFPAIRLQVIGKIKSGGSVEKLITRLNIADNLTFCSGISTQTLVEKYAQASIAVCPSLYEGFGLPVGEAMACGLPVISSNGGALPEVVGDSGIIVKAGDAVALARAIRTLFVDPARASFLGKVGRERILNHFTWRQAATRLTDYYGEILHANRRL